MSLPMMSTTVYSVNIPSTGQKIHFRPFLVREEKALLLAQQSEETSVMIDTLKEVIKNCIKEQIDPNKLAVFDIEYLFTQIRAKSVGETVDLIFTCASCENEKNTVKMSIDLTKIDVIRDPNHTNKIHLFDECGVIMRYPNLDTFRKAAGKEEDINAIMEVIVDCIESIYNGEEMFYSEDHSRKELEEFVMNLTKQQFDKIEEFFVSVPKFKHNVEFVCPACNAINKTSLEGTASFF